MNVGRVERVDSRGPHVVYGGNDAATDPLRIPDMPLGVLDGKLGDICLRRLDRFPIAYAWPALLTVAGTMAPRSLGTLRQTVYASLVGPVHTGKSQAISNAVAVMGLETPELLEVMAGSAEGLLGRLEDANGCARLLYVDELGHLLAKAHIEHASFPFLLNSAFYKTKFDVIAGKGRTFPFDCELSLIGGLVDDQFQDLFDVSTIHGLYDRFVFGLCPKPFEYSYRPPEGTAEYFDVAPVRVAVDRDCWEVKDQWVKTVPGMSGRMAEIALRVAGICASFDGRRLLCARDLEPALEFAKYQVKVREVLYPNPGQNADAQCAFAILEKLKKENGQWVTKRDVGRAIHAERFGPSVFRRAGDNLAFNDEIERQFFDTAKKTGKKLEHWRLAQ